MNVIGGTLIINELLIQTFGGLPQLFGSFLPYTGDRLYAVQETMYLLIYLACFMIPVAFFRLFSIGYEMQPMRLQPKANRDTALLIVAGMGVISAAAVLNSILFSWADYSVLYGSEELDKPFKLLIAFVSTALVPAVCEEFLFRGCVLSNMLPYGKATAVFGSALMFSLMHANYPQYLYTFCAGIVLGLLYTETGSVWPGMFLHLFNNFLSVIYEYLDSAGDLETAYRIYVSVDAVLMIAGAAAVAVLIFRARGRVSPDYTGACPTFVGKPDRGPVKSIMAPMVIAFTALSVFLATIVLMYTFIY